MTIKIALPVSGIACCLLVLGCAEIKDTGRTIGHGARDVATSVGHATRDTVKSIGRNTKKVVDDLNDEEGVQQE